MKNIHVTIIVTIVLLFSGNQNRASYLGSIKKCNVAHNGMQRYVNEEVSNNPKQKTIEAGELLHENLFFSRYHF